MKTNKENFEQAFEAELQKRLGFRATGGLVGDELANAEPLLAIAERLHNAPVPSLSDSAKLRVEHQLHQYLDTMPKQPTSIQRLQRWKLLVAGLMLILGVSAGIWMIGNSTDNSSTTKVTQLTQSANANSVSATAPATPSTLTPTVANNTSPHQTIPPVDDSDLPLGTLTPPRNIEMASGAGFALCGNSLDYWKNNPTQWIGTTLILGDQSYDQAELLTILEASPQDDASILAAQTLIYAYLNGYVDADLADLNALLTDYQGKLPFAVTLASDDGLLMVNTIANLASTTDCLTATPVDVNNAAPDEINNGNDPDNCKNPPPNHANAQGWRERCENGNVNGNGNGNSGNNGNNGNGNGNGNGNNKN